MPFHLTEPSRAWTEAEDDLLRELWTAPDEPSARVIGDKMGRPKGSIIGRAHRLGLSREGPKNIVRKPKPQQPAKPRITPPPAVRSPEEPAPMTPIRDSREYLRTLHPLPPMPRELTGRHTPSHHVARASNMVCEAVTLLERGPDQCTWPLWDDRTPPEERRYCGRPWAGVEGKSWCAEHMRVGHAARERDAMMRGRVG